MATDRKRSSRWMTIVACVLWTVSNTYATAVRGASPDADQSIWTRAICPIVYPVDETPSSRGYQYAFYGNAFFISRDGTLITAAHVLHSFRDGGQPHILVARNEAPPQMLKATVVTVDQEHDVAVLRATPNPFSGRYRVGILSLDGEMPIPGDRVVVAALRPSRRQPRTFLAELQDRTEACVLDYQSSPLEKGLGETDLLLFNHEVILGQSGAPVLSADKHDVVGFVEGQWLHPAASVTTRVEPGATSIGAAVPISYAIKLLRERGISWGDGANGKPSVAAKEVTTGKS